MDAARRLGKGKSGVEIKNNDSFPRDGSLEKSTMPPWSQYFKPRYRSASVGEEDRRTWLQIAEGMRQK